MSIKSAVYTAALCTLLVSLPSGCTQKKDNTLVIYAYDSFSWITDTLTVEFAQKHNCTVEFVSFESTSMIVTRLILEKSSPKADIAIGFTPTTLVQAKKEDVLQPYKSKNLNKITNADLLFDTEHYTTPYDYGSLAIVYKPEALTHPPQSFDDLLAHKRSIVIQDPRTSSTGTDFLLWTIALYGDQWNQYWENFRECVITASPGWSESFAAFEHGEASMMTSYATDRAYAVHTYGSSAYEVLIPGGKGYIQTEGASLVSGSTQSKLAKAFIDFMLEDRFQEEIPLNQWMFPVTDVELPDVFADHAVVPHKNITLDPVFVEENIDIWLSQWENIMGL